MVIWKDATSQDDWTPAKDISPLYSTVRTIGQYITENEEALTLGLNHDLDNDNWSCIIHIPKGMISERIPLLPGP
jgi:hypothetical protein